MNACFVSDTIGTLALLPLITNLLMTKAVHRELRTGRLTPLRNPMVGGPILRALPHKRPARGIALATGCVVVLGPPVTAILIIADFGDVSPLAFVVYKAALGIALGTIVTPVIALHAMADHPTHRSTIVGLAREPAKGSDVEGSP